LVSDSDPFPIFSAALIHKIPAEFFYSSATSFWLDQPSRISSTVLPYKPGPQARYLVDKMAESEKTLIDAANRLSEKLDGYGKSFSAIS
jgi:hypothetical protein